jgi:hypothetical protein
MFITLLVTTILVALTVLIHFEALRWLSVFMPSVVELAPAAFGRGGRSFFFFVISAGW